MEHVAASETDDRARPRPPRLPWWKTLLFSVVTVAVLLSVPEGLMRLFNYPPPPKLSPIGADIFWGLTANLKNEPFFHKELGTYFKVSTNSHSLRYADVPVGRQAKTIRLLALGDSTTFGWGVEQELTYPAQLEKLLQARYPDVKIEVLNGGVPGYTSFQGLHHYRHKAAAYQTDLVLFGYIVQDARKVPVTDKDQAIEALSARLWETRFLYRLHLYRFLSERFAWIRSWRQDQQIKSVVRDPNNLTRVPLDDYRENILTFERFCQENGSQLILFGFPLEVAGYTSEHRKALAAIAKERGLEHFDPSDVVAAAARQDTLYFPQDRGHPNTAGCKLIASQLDGWLAERRLIPKVITERK